MPTDVMSAAARKAARRVVIAAHARLRSKGKPVFCTPSRAELNDPERRKQGPGTDGKVIFDSRAAAESAARGLEALGARPLRAVVCKRGSRGHFHLTTDNPAAREQEGPGVD